jgi:hypothetical protein
MRLSTVCLVLSTLFVAGCVSTSPAERRAADENTCRSYGFKPRTTAFAECLQRIDLSRDADRRARFTNDGFYGPGIGVGRYGRYW